MEESLKAVLVGAGEERHLGELGRLVETLGAECVGTTEQARRDGSGYIGKGKRQELSVLVSDTGADFVVTDDELTASQARVLERDCGVEVVDRTALIIRIFESHARDAASRLEVELAGLTYRLPRVKGSSEALSRLGGGGMTTRGPGEQKLEYDRRVIRERIQTITKRLRQEGLSRDIQNRRRKEHQGPPTVALVGYTNAGKTTILNSLSGAERSTKDRLFETLETTTRLVQTAKTDNTIESRPDFLITDTVGFIQKLPTQLVHSFASTLQAARESDIVVLCADASSGDLEENIKTVKSTLSQGGAENSDYILCLNKVDLLADDDLKSLEERYKEDVTISAAQNTEALADRIHEEISAFRPKIKLLIPHEQYGLVAELYRTSEIHFSENVNEGVSLEASIPKSQVEKYAKYIL
jgi:GTP-binding protein HflX